MRPAARLARSVRRLAVALSTVALFGCGDDDAPSSSSVKPPSPKPKECEPGTRAVEGAGCVPAGTQDNGCEAGDVAVEDACVPGGTFACAPGFAPDSRAGCVAVLPASPCADGLMALPGETVCRPVAPCGQGTWGDVPAGPGDEFVDLAYAGGDSDGSMAKPWTTVQAGVDAAAPGAIVAVAAGTYAENVSIVASPVRLWGRCPSMVAIESTMAAPWGSVGVGNGLVGVEIHGLAFTGDGNGIVVAGATDVAIQRVWIHDVGGRGIDSTNQFGPSSFAVGDSLIERAHEIGVVIGGVQATVDASVIRATQPAGSKFGWGISVADHGGAEGVLHLSGSVIENNREIGVDVYRSEATIERTLVRGTVPAGVQRGWGVDAASSTSGARAKLTMTDTVVEQNRSAGIRVSSADATLERVSVRGTTATDGTLGAAGIGIVDAAGVEGATCTMRSSAVTANQSLGVYVAGGTADVEDSIVEGTQPALDGTLGRAFHVEPSEQSGLRSVLALKTSRVLGNRDAGIVVTGGDATIEATRLSDTTSGQGMGFGRGIDVVDNGGPSNVEVRTSIIERSQAGGLTCYNSTLTLAASRIADMQPAPDGAFGAGLQTQTILPGVRATLAVSDSVVTRAYQGGVLVIDADAVIDGTLIEHVQPAVITGSLGDGIAVVTASGARATATVRGSLVSDTARAGISVFDAFVELSDTALRCNAFPLDAESAGDGAELHDGGGNTCGCGDDRSPCATASSNLVPPTPLDSD